MTSDMYRNQRGLFDPDTAGHQHVTVVGAGSVGAHVIASLASLGVKTMDIWDADTVEDHNLPALNSVYRADDMGSHKVDAAQKFLWRQRLPTRVTRHYTFVDERSPLSGVVFACPDKLSARRAAFLAAQANMAHVPQFFDLRVGVPQIKLIRLNPADGKAAERYLSPLYLRDDALVPPLPCAQHSVTDVAQAVAVLAVSQYRLWVAHHLTEEGVMPKAVITENLHTKVCTTSDTL